MKAIRKAKAMTVALVLFLLLTTSGLAATAASGTWTVSTTEVPPLGNGGVTKKSNLKRTNSGYASFNGDSLPGGFGFRVTLVNDKNVNRSATVGLQKDHTVHASGNSGKVGRHYWARVNSLKYELLKNNVKLHFSSDKK